MAGTRQYTPRMPSRFIQGFFFSLGLMLLAACLVLIPLQGSNIFLSPDETATAVAAQTFAKQGNMRLAAPETVDFPWLHPRSFVSQNGAIVPVGFLGLPFLAGILDKILGDWILVWFVPLLVLASLFPLWKLFRPFGFAGQVAGLLTWLSFPPVILYANRGLFPNLPVLALTIWAMYFAQNRRQLRSVVLLGLCVGLALAIRPTEFFWVLPWVATAAWFSRTENPNVSKWRIVLALAVASAVGAVLWYVGLKTYEAPFTIGYFLKDVVAKGTTKVTVQILGGSSTSTLFHWLPFGFHPHHMWFNTKNYFGVVLWPWLLPIGAAVAFWWRSKNFRLLAAISLWSVGSLLLVYGQGVYQDHVGLNVVSIGNSFLRYLLPLSFICALAVAASAQKLLDLKVQLVGGLAGCAMFAMVLYGLRLALVSDQEGIIPAAHELQRYAQIQNEVLRATDPRIPIMSDRSDKIFFPAFKVASPLPSFANIAKLALKGPVGYFGEPLSNEQIKNLIELGLSPTPVLLAGSQVFYLFGVDPSLAP